MNRSLHLPMIVLLLAVAACDVGGPAGVGEGLFDLLRVSMTGAKPADIDARPQLVNWRELGPRLVASYPNELRKVGQQRYVRLSLLLEETGEVSRVVVDESSGSPPVDTAAIEIGRASRYTPPTRHGEPTRVWLEKVLVLWPLIVLDGEPRPDLVELSDILKSRIETLVIEPMPELGSWAGFKVIQITTTDP